LSLLKRRAERNAVNESKRKVLIGIAFAAVGLPLSVLSPATRVSAEPLRLGAYRGAEALSFISLP
jgi:hypothetical protein